MNEQNEKANGVKRKQLGNLDKGHLGIFLHYYYNCRGNLKSYQDRNVLKNSETELAYLSFMGQRSFVQLVE